MLDTELLKKLPPEYKERLVEFEKTFASKGWSFVQEWAEKTAEEMEQRLLFATSWEQYNDIRGRWFAFQELAKLEEATYNEFENIARQIAEAEIEEVDVGEEFL